ncbi:uncharacterized protein LOC118810039 [Colossoma macropomum]|uniref:uncharacterized protein LOC118810039 n=1 Tax=Colossoma macropomum TaxID=42526 RepID=UPI0018654A81|nr:uncharacterized protein LOC118810039 [Colossoma macropomum]
MNPGFRRSFSASIPAGDRMAENEESKCQENISQKSPTSEKGTAIWKTITQTFSSRGEKNKRREKEDTEDTSPTCSTDTPDTPKEGIFRKLSGIRRSLNNGQKNRRKSSQALCSSASVNESPEKLVTDRRNSKDCKIPFRQNIPPKPLSVLEIDELLKRGDLETAYLNLLSLRLEIQRDLKALSEKTPSVELPNKKKDLSMLFETLRKKLTDIVRRPFDSTSSELLMHAANIIQEEEKQEGDPGGMRGWMDAWKAAIKDGVRDTLKGVHLDSCENNASWLAVHLGLLGKAIVELLEKVKTELVSSYPLSFNVFETYVSSCHEVVEEHLKELQGKVTELKDYYAMLDFAINSYHSEKILGSPSLQPEMKEQKTLTLPYDFLDQIRKKYCNCLQEVLHASLENVIKLEEEGVWKKKGTPERTEDGRFLTSHIHMDISTLIANLGKNSEKIDGNLEKRVLCCCLEELKQFPKRFEEEFTKQCSSLLESDLLDCCLWAEYHVAYINSFSSLIEQMESYRGSFPDQVEQLVSEVDSLILRLRRALLEQFRAEIEPCKECLMTKKWLNTDDAFYEIINRIETYSGYTKSMKSSPAQSFANDLQYHVVKEYISELLKSKYSCRGRKNDVAAAKIKDQWNQLRKLFSEMGSALNWLHPLGDQLSEIIEQENEKDIKNLLPPLVDNYPDISEKQLSAILYFRDKGIVTYSKINPVIRHFTELKQSYGKKNHEHTFFSDIKQKHPCAAFKPNVFHHRELIYCIMAFCCPCMRPLACFRSQAEDDDDDDDDKTKDEDENVTLKNFTSLRFKTEGTPEGSVEETKNKKRVWMDRMNGTPQKSVEERKNSERVSDSFICNIPHKALSVSEINELLKNDSLKEAYGNLLSLRREIQREREALGETTPLVELTNKEKDLSQLCKTLRNKLTDIVRHSCDSTSKKLLMHAAHIIQEEEKREGDPGGMRGWMDAWRAAVKDGVTEKLEGVHLDSCENNASWLAVHLGLLGKAIVELLEKVKTELVSSYPPSFNVFETYVSSCHEFVEEHLSELLGQITELKDYYAMLDFAINSYHSEKILGRPSLQPEMKEQKALALPDDFLEQIKQKYCNCLQKNLQTLLGNIIKVEHDDVWKKKQMPQSIVDGRFPISEIHIDILKIIAGFAENSKKIDGNLEKRVLCCCLEALRPFPKRFEEELSKQNSSLLGSNVLDCCLWAKYHVAYINSFISLKEEMERYRGSCPDQEDRLGMEVDRLVLRLRQALLEQFKAEIEPYKESLMTKKWLKTDDDFNEIINRIETYSGYTKSMKSPPAQSFANDLHYHAVKEYISELLKEKYSCKGRKNGLGAAKIKGQWDQLIKLFSEMGSTLNWLHPLGDQLSKIIEQKNERDIKKLLPSFVENYPDISKKQLSAILYFRERGIVRHSKIHPVIRRFTELKQNSEKKNHEHTFFSDIK